ncbi:hypothetical protein SAMN02910409_1443 [Prevotellaceae bacterium HUN156]|nr:hypothetical protein SAMN02910409_1443 [Prevotellaceae bacterium HUN156]
MLIVCQLLTYYHVVVDCEKDEKDEKDEKNKKDENFIIKFRFRIFSIFWGVFGMSKFSKFSTSMLIVDKLLTCQKRPVYRGLRGVMLIG